MEETDKLAINGHSKYNLESKRCKKKVSPLDDLYPPLPKNIFISAAEFKYPTLKLKELKTLDVASMIAPDYILFLWTTGPQVANAIEFGAAWGFEYKTVAFVWDKQIHNPGRYTLSQTEFVFAFKKGRFSFPRGARNVRQLVSTYCSEHSKKPVEVIEGITRMFSERRKIELFARSNYANWDTWGLEAPGNGTNISRDKNADDSNDLYMKPVGSTDSTPHAIPSF